MKKPLVLTILDGYGLSEHQEGNAIAAARTPNIDQLFMNFPHTRIGASGMDVGLPEGQMGNSEVGHTNIGAGRIVYQELTRITKSIHDGDFFENSVLIDAIKNCKETDKALHLIGLVSDGGVHSHNSHLYALLKLAAQYQVPEVHVHAFFDGRDVSPTSGVHYLEELLEQMRQIGTGQLSSLMGRYYAMDRDTQWDRVRLAYHAIMQGEGPQTNAPVQMLQKSYENQVTDEFILPTVCEGYRGVNPGDSMIFFNFRPDRARELTRAIVDSDFSGFPRKSGSVPLYFVCMTEYDATIKNVHVAFPPKNLTMTLGEYLSKCGKTQLRIAETTKYAHVTFFFNGGEEIEFEGEDRILIPTPNVETFDLKPEMSAFEVCDAVSEAILNGKYDVIILNFANCDMVGHTGIMSAAIQAVEAVDACVGRVSSAVSQMDGVMILTADHGNADQMLDSDGSAFTAHTTNPVPFLIQGYPCRLREDGRLADISPTVLHILGLKKPEEMNGKSLIL